MNHRVPRSTLILRLARPLLLAGLLLWLAANTAPVQAVAGRFVSPTGSDSGNDCTDHHNPCATFYHALEMGRCR